MQKVKNRIIPGIFLSTFEEIKHKYPTLFSKCNFKYFAAFMS